MWDERRNIRVDRLKSSFKIIIKISHLFQSLMWCHLPSCTLWSQAWRRKSTPQAVRWLSECLLWWALNWENWLHSICQKSICWKYGLECLGRIQIKVNLFALKNKDDSQHFCSLSSVILDFFFFLNNLQKCCTDWSFSTSPGISRHLLRHTPLLIPLLPPSLGNAPPPWALLLFHFHTADSTHPSISG